jgi:hypothetical protein
MEPPAPGSAGDRCRGGAAAHDEGSGIALDAGAECLKFSTDLGRLAGGPAADQEVRPTTAGPLHAEQVGL